MGYSPVSVPVSGVWEKQTNRLGFSGRARDKKDLWKGNMAVEIRPARLYCAFKGHLDYAKWGLKYSEWVKGSGSSLGE
jgi:hypothetical protein